MTEPEQELTAGAVDGLLLMLSQRESLLVEYLARTGLSADQVVLHQKTTDDGSITSWYEPK